MQIPNTISIYEVKERCFVVYFHFKPKVCTIKAKIMDCSSIVGVTKILFKAVSASFFPANLSFHNSNSYS
jgi:hypothetical protein